MAHIICKLSSKFKEKMTMLILHLCYARHTQPMRYTCCCLKDSRRIAERDGLLVGWPAEATTRTSGPPFTFIVLVR